MFTINDKLLAEYVDVEQSNNGKFYFKSSDALQVKTAMRVLDRIVNDDHYVIDILDTNRSLPYWLYAAIASALAPKTVSLLVPNYSQPVLIPNTNVPQGAGSGPINFYGPETEDFTLVQFASPRSLQPDQLASIIPQIANPHKGVVISSGAPPWIIATIALAFGKTTRWVAITQKRGNPVVTISNDKNMPVGTELAQAKVDIAMQMVGVFAVPRRGEIWLFDDGYGEHPGIIMSNEERNRKSLDILVIPTTTKPTHAHRHLQVTRAETGLDQDCFAAYSNISRIAKEQLVRKAPIGNASPALMDKLVALVNESISNVA